MINTDGNATKIDSETSDNILNNKGFSEYNIVEYSALREEIISHQGRQSNAIIYSLIANGFVLAWLTSGIHRDGDFKILIVIGAWIPFLVSILGLVFFRQATRDIGRIAKYCMRLEKKFLPIDLGWESFLHEERKSGWYRSSFLYFSVFALQISLSIFIGAFIIGRFYIGKI